MSEIWTMNAKILAPLTLCALLGACAAPTGPYHVSAVADEKVSDKRFAADDSACKAKTRAVTDAEAAAGQLDVQSHFDKLYGDCMLTKGYDLDVVRRHYAYYGPYYYGPGPYWGGGFYYGGGWGYRHW
jgi:hypothetical protein